MFQPTWTQAATAVGDVGAAAPAERGRGDHGGKVEPEVIEQAHEIARPAHPDGGGSHGVFEHQVPADDPGDELAHGGVGVGVRAPGHRHGAGHLGVAETRQSAGDGGHDERERHRRARVQRRRDAGQHEDSGADDGADAEHGEIERAERALQRTLAGGFGLGPECSNGLGGPQVHATVTSS